MKRWFWKRWAWAGVVGATVGMGLCLAQPGGKEAPPGPPKVGDVISLKFKDGPERQVKIVKSEKQPDGSIHSEVKDTKTGETFTLVDNPGDAPPAGKAPAAAPADTAPPKAKQRASDPLLPSVKTPMPETPRERMTPPTPGADKPDQEPEKPKRRPLLGRIFGRKPDSSDKDRDRDNARDTGGAMPSVPVNEPPLNNPALARPSPSSGAGGLSPPAPPATPPAVRPTPTATNPPPVRPTPAPATPPTPTPPAAPPGERGGSPPPQPPAGGTAEPPRTLPVKPAQPMAPPAGAPATPPVSAPVQVPPLPGSTAPPPTAPAVPAAPPAAPTTPSVPSIPSVPAVPVPAAPSAPGGLPSIPVPPGGTAMGDGPGVVPAAHASPTDALPDEVQQHMTTLRLEAAPSRRAMAVRAMTTGPHASTDAVKAAVFGACQKDPSAFVRGYCIDELCRLGYREAAFLEYLEKACADPSDDVKTSAKLALARLKAPE